MKNKTRKLLGRFIALLIILVLSLSVFSCAKAPTEDGAVVDSLKTENNIPPENNKEKTGEKTDSPTENATDLDTKEAEQNNEAQDPMAFTVNDKFSAYEVAVVLTDEETAKNKEYTTADFEGYDIFGIIDYNCYPEQYYPEHKGRRSFVLLLNEPSKERVLEYCKSLSKDPRVELAEPNIYSISTDYLYIKLSELGIKNHDNITLKWFDNVEIDYIYNDGGKEDAHLVLLKKSNEQTLYENIKKLMSNEYIKDVWPLYHSADENKLVVAITHERSIENNSFVKADFPEVDVIYVAGVKEKNEEYVDGKSVTVPTYCEVTLKINCTKRIYKLIEQLENNPIVKNVDYSQSMTIDRNNDESCYIRF